MLPVNVNGRSMAFCPPRGGVNRHWLITRLAQSMTARSAGAVATTSVGPVVPSRSMIQRSSSVSATICGGITCLARATSTRQSATCVNCCAISRSSTRGSMKPGGPAGAASSVDAARAIDFSLGELRASWVSIRFIGDGAGRDSDPAGLAQRGPVHQPQRATNVSDGVAAGSTAGVTGTFCRPRAERPGQAPLHPAAPAPAPPQTSQAPPAAPTPIPTFPPHASPTSTTTPITELVHHCARRKSNPFPASRLLRRSAAYGPVSSCSGTSASGAGR